MSHKSMCDTVSMDSQSLMQKQVDTILARAKAQPEPLKKGSKEGDQYEKFFDAIATVWHVADEFNLTKDIPFTNFLMFGPQSAGKTTITERILGFPVAVVKTGIGTTRPMVLTTRRSTEEMIQVKGSDDSEFQVIRKEDVMNWVQEQMMATGSVSGRPQISKDRIYIEVSGPGYMNRRFVDLPGFQSNDEAGKGTRQAILELLRTEMENPDTIVVCVEDARQDFANSNLVIAIKEVFGENFVKNSNLVQRFVFAFNKSDTWLSTGEVTEKSFLEHLSSYVDGCGLLPIIVGSSVDPSNSTLRSARVDGHADFETVVEEYRQADEREAELYDKVFAKLSLGKDLEACLERKFRGFDTLLGTVDAMVVNRDILNAKRIERQLQHIRDSTLQTILELERKEKILRGTDNDDTLRVSKRIVKDLLSCLSQIATSDFGGASVIAASDVGEITRHGNDARMEEMEFAFGSRTDKTVPHGLGDPFKGYYDPNLPYNITDTTILDLPQESVDAWKKQILATVEQLSRSDVPPSIGGISYLNTRLVGGAVYERAIGVWSSSVYKLVAPSPEDLLRLANTVGIDPELNDPSRFDFKKAKRLAEIYIHRLAPAIHYLCQKMEFLLLKNFDTAWRALLRNKANRTFVEAVGGDAFKREIRLTFEKAVRRKAGLAYSKCFADLHSEVNKLLPYSTDRASVTGLVFAYPGIADDVRKARTGYESAVRESVIQKYIRDTFPEGFSDQVKAGIEFGMKLLVTAGSVDPLLLAGLYVVKIVLLSSKIFVKRAKRRELQNLSGPPGEEVRAEDRDERLLGFAACLYSHFVPRFITSVDARMRSDLWAGVKDTKLNEELEEFLADSIAIKRAKRKVQQLCGQIKTFKKKEASIRDAQSMLAEIRLDVSGDTEGEEIPEIEDYYASVSEEDEIEYDPEILCEENEVEYEPESFYGSSTGYDESYSQGGDSIADSDSLSAKPRNRKPLKGFIKDRLIRRSKVSGSDRSPSSVCDPPENLETY